MGCSNSNSVVPSVKAKEKNDTRPAQQPKEICEIPEKNSEEVGKEERAQMNLIEKQNQIQSQ